MAFSDICCVCGGDIDLDIQCNSMWISTWFREITYVFAKRAITPAMDCSRAVQFLDAYPTPGLFFLWRPTHAV